MLDSETLQSTPLITSTVSNAPESRRFLLRMKGMRGWDFSRSKKRVSIKSINGTQPSAKNTLLWWKDNGAVTALFFKYA